MHHKKLLLDNKVNVQGAEAQVLYQGKSLGGEAVIKIAPWHLQELRRFCLRELCLNKVRLSSWCLWNNCKSITLGLMAVLQVVVGSSPWSSGAGSFRTPMNNRRWSSILSFGTLCTLIIVTCAEHDRLFVQDYFGVILPDVYLEVLFESLQQ